MRIISLLLVVLVHEAGHIIMSYAVGAEVVSVRSGIGGMKIKYRESGITYVKELAICSAGALFNLLTAALPFVSTYFKAYSIGAAAYNLLPLPGSDGGGIIYCIFSYFFRKNDTAVRISRAAEDVTLVVTWLLTMYFNLTGKMTPALMLAVTLMIIRRAEPLSGDKKRRNLKKSDRFF